MVVSPKRSAIVITAALALTLPVPGIAQEAPSAVSSRAAACEERGDVPLRLGAVTVPHGAQAQGATQVVTPSYMLFVPHGADGALSWSYQGTLGACIDVVCLTDGESGAPAAWIWTSDTDNGSQQLPEGASGAIASKGLGAQNVSVCCPGENGAANAEELLATVSQSLGSVLSLAQGDKGVVLPDLEVRTPFFTVTVPPDLYPSGWYYTANAETDVGGDLLWYEIQLVGLGGEEHLALRAAPSAPGEGWEELLPAAREGAWADWSVYASAHSPTVRVTTAERPGERAGGEYPVVTSDGASVNLYAPAYTVAVPLEHVGEGFCFSYHDGAADPYGSNDMRDLLEVHFGDGLTVDESKWFEVYTSAEQSPGLVGAQGVPSGVLALDGSSVMLGWPYGGLNGRYPDEAAAIALEHVSWVRPAVWGA